MSILLNVLALLVIGATLLPLVRTDAWWVRSFDFPKAQLFVLGGIVLITGLLLNPPHSPGMTLVPGLLAGCMILLAWRIVPYTPVARVQVPLTDPGANGPRVRFFCANVLQSNRDAARLLARIEAEDPDVILLVETDMWWANAMAPLEDRYAHATKHPLDTT